MNILSSLLNFVGANFPTVEVTKSSVSSMPISITDSRINSHHVCTKAVLSNPAAQTGDWTVTTSDYTNSSTPNLVISGTISGTTDVTLYMNYKQ